MKKFLIVSSAALMILAIVIANKSGARAGEHSVVWTTVSDALEKAPKQQKMIVLDVYTDWCGWCKRMDKDSYEEAQVAAYINQRYIAAKMNPEKQGTITFDGKEYTQAQFAQALGITGYPATVFFNEKGEVLTMVSGYLGPAEFLKILKYFGDGHYLAMTWEEYSKGTN